MSDLYQSLSHSRWDCKYHVVFVPKRRRKVLFGKTRRQLGEIFHALARQKECQIVEGHLMPDTVHMCSAMRGVSDSICREAKAGVNTVAVIFASFNFLPSHSQNSVRDEMLIINSVFVHYSRLGVKLVVRFRLPTSDSS